MCGIAGVWDRDGSTEGILSRLRSISQAMAHRGPDDKGEMVWPSSGLGLAHRRLSILDLSPLGRQPMGSVDGRFAIVFNGEIYNYHLLKEELESKGYRFGTGTDTEVLLALYQELGSAMCCRLRGMYALGIWDGQEQELFLARDPYGIKPLYCCQLEGSFAFASSVKALMAGGAIPYERDPAGVVSFHMFGYVAGPHTIQKRIRELPPGSCLTVRDARAGSPTRFFSLGDVLADALESPAPKEPMREVLGAAVRDAVKAHLVSDVPVGLFLSGGMDSNLLLSLLSEVGPPPQTLTLGFQEYRGGSRDETVLAEKSAASFGCRHATHWIARSDFEEWCDDILEKMDQPSVDGFNTYLVSRFARKAGFTVALSGLGGDELFGGYPSFHDVPQVVRRFGPLSRVPGLGRAFRKAAYPFLRRRTSPKYAGIIEHGGSLASAYLLRRAHNLPFEVEMALDPEVFREGWESLQVTARLNEVQRPGLNDHAQIVLMESQWYMLNQLLRDSDWASMAHSIELRTPLVDIELFKSLAPYIVRPNPPQKKDVADALLTPLSKDLLSRPKTGFYVPVREWLIARSPEWTDRSVRGAIRFLDQTAA